MRTMELQTINPFCLEQLGQLKSSSELESKCVPHPSDICLLWAPGSDSVNVPPSDAANQAALL